MVMILQAVLVPHHLPVQLVHQFVDGGVQVGVRAFGKHVAAFHVNIAFRSLPSFLLLLLLHGEQHLDVHNLVKVANDLSSLVVT